MDALEKLLNEYKRRSLLYYLPEFLRELNEISKKYNGIFREGSSCVYIAGHSVALHLVFDNIVIIANYVRIPDKNGEKEIIRISLRERKSGTVRFFYEENDRIVIKKLTEKGEKEVFELPKGSETKEYFRGIKQEGIYRKAIEIIRKNLQNSS